MSKMSISLSTKTKKIALILSIILLLIGSGLISYFFSQKSETKQTKSNTIVATIFPLASITQQIAGDDYQIVQILPSGSSPHTFEPDFQTVEKIESADIIFTIGQTIDDWALNYNKKTIDVSTNVNLLASNSTDEHDHEDTDEHSTSLYDPHYWLSPQNGKLMAEIITQQLSIQYPQDEQLFKNNLTTFKNSIDSLVKEEKDNFAKHDHIGIVTFHNAYNYLANDFDFSVIATVETFPGKEPTIQYLQHLNQTIRNYNLTTLYKEPQLSDKVLQPLADDYQINILTLDPLGGTKELATYQQLIRYNLEQILRSAQ